MSSHEISFLYIIQLGAEFILPLALSGAIVYYFRRLQFQVLGGEFYKQNDEAGMEYAARRMWMSTHIMQGCLLLAAAAGLNLYLMIGSLPAMTPDASSAEISTSDLVLIGAASIAIIATLTAVLYFNIQRIRTKFLSAGMNQDDPAFKKALLRFLLKFQGGVMAVSAIAIGLYLTVG